MSSVSLNNTSASLPMLFETKKKNLPSKKVRTTNQKWASKASKAKICRAKKSEPMKNERMSKAKNVPSQKVRTGLRQKFAEQKSPDRPPIKNEQSVQGKICRAKKSEPMKNEPRTSKTKNVPSQKVGTNKKWADRLREKSSKAEYAEQKSPNQWKMSRERLRQNVPSQKVRTNKKRADV